MNKRLVFILMMSVLVWPTAVFLEEESPSASCTVYVQLDKYSAVDDASYKEWVVQSTGGFLIQAVHDARIQEPLRDTEVTIRCYGDGRLTLNGRRTRLRSVRLMPALEGVAAALSVGDSQYLGGLYLLYANRTWYLVNGVDLEDYVCSVLKSESWPGWPLEMNKALAIVFRSYVVAKLVHARSKKRLGQNGFFYDVMSSNMHQTYRGVHQHAALREAVEATRGLVLSHKQKPVVAMYDVCCGGVIPARMHGVNFRSEPYLARTYACTFCAGCKAYSWEATYTGEELEKLLAESAMPISSISRVQVARADRAGVVRDVMVKGRRKEARLSGKKVYALCKEVKSFCFSITKAAGKYVFSGRGYGHHLGLCQWGAREMIKQGQSWTDVLKFYYPGTTLMKLTVVAT